MSLAILFVIVCFGLFCLALGVMRVLLSRSGVVLSAFLGTAAALCLGYMLVALLFTRQITYVASEEDTPAVETVDVVVNAATLPSETNTLIDLSEEGDKDKVRPAWVESEPVLEGDLYKMSVASDPKLTPLEAEQDLIDKTYHATQDYLTNLLDKDATMHFALSEEFIADHILKEKHFETVDLPVSKMVIAHGLLVFDKNLRDEFRAEYQATKIRWRMLQAGGLAALVLVVIGTLFGYLKLDTATRGYYSGRLQLTAGALILAVVWAGYMLMDSPR